MEYSIDNSTAILRLKKGEKIMETILPFLEENQIHSGYLSGLGAVSQVTIQRYVLEEQKYESLELKGEFEVTGLTGTITRLDGMAHVHAHIVLGDKNFRALTGHLLDGLVAATLEVIIHKVNFPITRKYAKDIGLSLLCFEK